MKARFPCLVLSLFIIACSLDSVTPLPEGNSFSSAGTTPTKMSKAAVGVVVIDASSSSPGQSDRCSQVIARAAQLLATKARTTVLMSLTTGDQESGNEPMTLTDWRVFRRDRQAFESPDADEKKRRAFLSEIDEECRRRYRSRGGSPIFAAAARAVESTKAKTVELEATGAEVTATVFIHSDLRENADERIARHLAPRRRSKLPALPRLETDGITVKVCGINDHVGVAQDSDDVRWIDEVWRRVIPNLGPLDTSCPSPSLTEAK